MALSPAKMAAEIYQKDLLAFIHRSFLELNPSATFEYSWHQEVRNEPKPMRFDYIKRFYHPKRRHSTIRYLGPIEFEQRAGAV